MPAEQNTVLVADDDDLVRKLLSAALPPLPPLDAAVLAFGCGMTQLEQCDERLGVPFCDAKQRLIHDFVAANHELMELQNQQTQAVIDQYPAFARFDDMIQMARDIKNKAKYALIAHTSEHHC